MITKQDLEDVILILKEMPVKERIAFIRSLGRAAGIDADRLSTGHPEDTSAYDKILEPAPEELTADQVYAQTAAKALTTDSVKTETQA